MVADKWEAYRKIKEKGYLPITAIDCGYALGEWTHGIRNVFPEIKVMGIDANSQIFTDGGADIKEGALLWSSDGVKLPFHRNNNPAGWCSGDSIFKETTQHYTDDKVRIEYMTSITLDTLCKKHNINKVDILKLDIQGAELECMRGFSEYLHSVDFVEIECAVVEYNKNAPDIYDILDHMRYMFDVCDLLETHYSYGKYDMIQVDFLFKNKKILLPMVI